MRLADQLACHQVDTATVATLYQPSSSVPVPRKRKVRPRTHLMTLQQQQSGDQDMLDMDNNDDDIYGESLTSMQQPSMEQATSSDVKKGPDEVDEDMTESDQQSRTWLCACSSTGILSVRLRICLRRVLPELRDSPARSTPCHLTSSCSALQRSSRRPCSTAIQG